MADCEIIINIVDKSPVYLVNIVDECAITPIVSDVFPFIFPFILS